jgi:hypothetical protein
MYGLSRNVAGNLTTDFTDDRSALINQEKARKAFAANYANQGLGINNPRSRSHEQS